MSNSLNKNQTEKLISILKKRKANFEKKNNELKGNYIDRITSLNRRIKELEEQGE